MVSRSIFRPCSLDAQDRFFDPLAGAHGIHEILHPGVGKGKEGRDLGFVAGEVLGKGVGRAGVTVVGDPIPVFPVAAVDHLRFMGRGFQKRDQVRIGDAEGDGSIESVENLEVGPIGVLITCVGQGLRPQGQIDCAVRASSMV